MSIIDDVLLNAKSAADSVGKKAGKVIDRSKLRLAALDVRSELSRKYRMLGKVCYEADRTGKDYSKGIKQLEDNISELIEQLERINELLASSEKKIKCYGCGTYNVKGAVFCSKCGVRLSEAKPQDEDEYSQEELLDFAEEIMEEDDDNV